MSARPVLVAVLILAAGLPAGAHAADGGKADDSFEPLCEFTQAKCALDGKLPCSECAELDGKSLCSAGRTLLADVRAWQESPKPPASNVSANEITKFNGRYTRIKKCSDAVFLSITRREAAMPPPSSPGTIKPAVQGAGGNKNKDSEEEAPFKAPLKLLKDNINDISKVVIEDLKTIKDDLLKEEEKLTAVVGEYRAGQAAGSLSEEKIEGLRTRRDEIDQRSATINRMIIRDSLIMDRADLSFQDKARPGGSTPGKDLNDLKQRITKLSGALEDVKALLALDPKKEQEKIKMKSEGEEKVKGALGTAGRLGAPVDPGQGEVLSEEKTPTDAPKGYAGLPSRPSLTTDLRRMPPPAPGGPPPVPPKILESAYRPANLKAVQEVAALRAAGKTETLGDPTRMKQFAYQQDGQTCAIGVQVQLRALTGKIKPPPPDYLLQEEKRLFDLAVKKDYFAGSKEDPDLRNKGGGIAALFGGNLTDLHIVRKIHAGPEDLREAVRNGPVIVSVDAGKFWNYKPPQGGGHAVLVTGVEVEKGTGKVLGYFVNDTGNNEGGRFVAAKHFERSWKTIMGVPQL